ncbi:aminoglycoside phosphotransferase family protein [Candidatus Sumerlaeota bacterium]|nr:aminoglycoside phosphotransferase family protein [Candidatus Sumerlaeota bacterium]
MRLEALKIVEQFQTRGTLQNIEPYGSGFIHDTYLAVFISGGVIYRFILQKFNRSIFKQPPLVMDNIVRVTDHLREKLKSTQPDDWQRRTLSPVPASSGFFYSRDAEGEYWRMYEFIEGGATFDKLEKPQQAFEAARAFGSFQAMLADLPAPRLHETIPDFHNTPKRLRDFQKALETDPLNRAKEAKPEIQFAIEQESIAPVLLDLHEKGEIPERVTHNDSKITNVIFDADSGEGLCVIDLDTVTPGLSLYDFGDMARSMGCPVLEDEEDLDKVYIHQPLYRHLAGGYLSGAGEALTKTEKENLVFGAILICYEQGLRFLGDYILGDPYYKTKYPGENLRRARVQFKLTRSLIENKEELQGIVNIL